jgi:hypothetical protein
MRVRLFGKLDFDRGRALCAGLNFKGHFIIFLDGLSQTVDVYKNAFLGLHIFDKAVTFGLVEKTDDTVTHNFLHDIFLFGDGDLDISRVDL